MYNRAKFHPHQTKDMREAMKIFSDWLKNISFSNVDHRSHWIL